MSQPPRPIDRAMKRDALLASTFFRAMRTEEVDEIIGFATEKRFAKGTTIFNKGDPGTSMMAMLVGRVRVSNVSSDGKEVTLNVIGPGEVLGEIALLDGKPRSAAAMALEDTTVMVVERRQFLPFVLRHESMVERLLVTLCDRLRKTSLALEDFALSDLPARLARVIMKFSVDYGRVIPPDQGGGIRIDLKLSQRDLATLVASSRESVNKQLRIWREDGSLDLVDGYLIVHKPRTLQALFE